MAKGLLGGYKGNITSFRELIMKKFLITILISTYSILAIGDNVTTCYVNDKCLHNATDELDHCIGDEFEIINDPILGSTYIPHLGFINNAPVEIEHDRERVSLFAYGQPLNIELETSADDDLKGVLSYKGYQFSVSCNIF